MESKCKLQIYPKAQEDMGCIFDYISNTLLNPSAALHLIEQFNNALDRVCVFPESCPLINNELINDKSLRKLIVENYILFYRHTESKIEVIRVLYGMSNYQSIL